MTDAITQQTGATTLQAQTQVQRDDQRQQKEEALAEARELADFRRHNPPRFEGDHDPDKDDLWLQEIKKIFEVLHYIGETKLKHVTFLVIREEKSLWRETKSIMQYEGEELT
ncbi:unnamed protein product [Lathyrus oleraceus]